jgi:hypothetical protein
VESIKKAQAARRAKLAQRAIVREKVENGLPITEEERAALNYKGGNSRSPGNTRTEKEILAAASKLMMRPQSLTELRHLVETTAAKHHYNPIEALIKQTNSPDLKESEKVAIHKALLPFLVPQLATPKATNETQDQGVKVTITSFVFPEQRGNGPIHAEKIVTAVDTPGTTAVPPPNP